MPKDHFQNVQQRSCLSNKKYLTCSVWNFNGFRCSTAQSIKQTGCEFFNNSLECNELICLSETWRDPIEHHGLLVNNHFSEVHEPGCKNHLGGRPSGGLSLLVHKSRFKYVSIAFSDSYHFWCKSDKTGFGWDHDLFICFVYIPPSSSPLLRTGQSLSFEIIQSECAHYERKGWVLFCGDFNARTNDVNDYSDNDEMDDYLPIDDNYLPDQQIDKRLTKDTYPSNANGTVFIEWCKYSGYHIMNGRIDKNNSSNVTCFANKGNSVVDYALLRQDNLSMVNKMSVGELCEHPDHSPNGISIKGPNVINISETHPDLSVMNSTTSDENTLLQTYTNQYYFNDASNLETLSLAIENNEINTVLENISNQLDNDQLPLEEIIALLRT